MSSKAWTTVKPLKNDNNGHIGAPCVVLYSDCPLMRCYCSAEKVWLEKRFGNNYILCTSVLHISPTSMQVMHELGRQEQGMLEPLKASMKSGRGGVGGD